MSAFTPLPLIEIWRHFTSVVWRKRSAGSGIAESTTDQWASSGDQGYAPLRGETLMPAADRTFEEDVMTLNQHADSDLKLCELQHRVDQLLEDNDSMSLELWAKDRILVMLAERIGELEDQP